MIPHLREKFNAEFEQQTYNAFIKDIDGSYRHSLEFRVSETPLFLSDFLAKRLVDAAHEIFSVVQRDDYNEKVKNAIPPGMAVANEDQHTTFLQIDFAICKDEQGDFIPQLIELQGFPSLYCYQHYFDRKLREYFSIPEGFKPFFNGLDSDSYQQLLGKVLLGDSDPDNTVLLELEPEKQKTRIDFYLCEEYFGIRPVCLTKVNHRRNKLYYKHNGREIPIERIYHRFIFDELMRSNVQTGFRWDDEALEVKWVGHPNWFFKISKYTLPLIHSQYCPPCYYLKDLSEYPADLENYVLKPLFSFAGLGVEIDVTPGLLDSIEDRRNYILQKKIEYASLIKTPGEYSKAEVRMMFVWDDEPVLVNNLLRLSKGKMMGVDYNKNKTWVGSSLAYHRL
jgi:hypothetical protein